MVNTVSSSIWTPVTYYIFYDDISYNTLAYFSQDGIFFLKETNSNGILIYLTPPLGQDMTQG